ncbi:Protein CBR-LGC-32 [Caenorhabditis briggsae]|uniref:Protein CBR-LGC-32 n=1 Tax=Caenorhabditis briggsae TaxID=6238 RepID=A8X5W0_CAEBR|nr:Protein CBR-LGC-32 [Caenorhabditis briggsae]CAP28021.2 Protein CBR-LGC-32 [Caenorhabditis briggsae]
MLYWFSVLIVLLPVLASANDCISEKKLLHYLQTVEPKETSKYSGFSSHYWCNVLCEKLDIQQARKPFGSRWVLCDELGRKSTIQVLRVVFNFKNDSLAFYHLNPCNPRIEISSDNTFFWKPDVFFIHSEEYEDDKTYRFFINENGSITASKRITRIMPCEVDDTKNPFSNATCTFSWKYTNLGSFDTISVETGKLITKPKTKENLIMHDVNYNSTSDDEFQINYHLSQHPQHLLVNFFYPSALFMVPAWLSLLLGPMAITRCCILMTSLILQCVHFLANEPGLLGNGGVTAVSIWKTFAYTFTIGIVVELILITLFASMGRSKTCCFSKRRSSKYEMEPLYEEMNDLRQRRRGRNKLKEQQLNNTKIF